MTSVTGKYHAWVRTPGQRRKSRRVHTISLHVTPLMQRLCSIRKGVGKNLQSQWFASKRWRQNMHVNPQRFCKATVKSTEYARAGNHEAVISRPMTLLLWEREPVDVLYIRRLSENNFAKLLSEDHRLHKTPTGLSSHKCKERS